MSINRKDLIIDFALGLLIAGFVCVGIKDQGFEIFHLLHNGTFVAGGFLFSAGVILYCANKGAFNLFGYSLKFGINLILPLGNNPWRATGERETYYDYCQRKAEAPNKAFAPLMIAGAAYILVSIVFVLLHYFL